MLTNKQVFSMFENKISIQKQYDKELSQYTLETHKLYPDDELVLKDIANKSFSIILKEDVDANLSEVYNYLKIIERL